VAHPALIGVDDIDVLYGNNTATPLREVHGYEPGWGTVGGSIREEITALMSG
jgi:glutamate synthase (ferredoxin)